MMQYVGNKRLPGEQLRTMGTMSICKMTFKDAKLKQKKESFHILSCFVIIEESSQEEEGGGGGGGSSYV